MANLTVPRPQEDPIRQRPIDTPRVRNSFSAENFGGGAARQGAFREAQEISQQGMAIAEEARRRAHILRMDEEKRAFDDWEFSILYDQEQGAASKKGKDAFGLEKETLEQFDKFTSEREGGLSTDEQRFAFRQAANQRREHVRRWVGDHVGRQVKVHEQTEFEAGIESTKMRGAMGDDLAKTELPYLRGLLLTRSKAEGWGAERTSLELRSHESDLHTRVIQRKLDGGDFAGASAYFEANKGKLIGNDASVMANRVRGKTILGESQIIRDRVFTPMFEAYIIREGEDGVREVPAPKTLKEAIERGRQYTEGKDAELQKAVDHQISAEWDLRQQAQKEGYLQLVDQATQIVAQTGSTDNIPDGLKRTDIMGLEALARQMRTKTEPTTDWPKYTALKDMAADPAQRKDFLELPPLSYRGYLSDSEFKEVTGWRAGLLKGDEKTKKQVDGYRTIAGIVGSTLDAAGFTKQDNLDERNIIEQVMDEEIKHYRVTHKDEDPPNEEVQKKITQLVTKAKVNDKWLNQYGYKTTKAYLDKADTEIPAGDRKAIEDEMKRQGIAPTRRGIVEAYEAKQGRKPYERWLPK